MEGGNSEFVNFTLPTIKAFLEACSHNVPGNKQYLVARAIGIGCPKTLFLRTCDLLVSQKTTQRHLFSPFIPFPQYFLQLQQYWHLYCFAILGLTSTVIHSVKQRLLRNQPRSALRHSLYLCFAESPNSSTQQQIIHQWNKEKN